MLNCFFSPVIAYFLCFVINDTSSAQRQKGLTGYCFKYTVKRRWVVCSCVMFHCETSKQVCTAWLQFHN